MKSIINNTRRYQHSLRRLIMACAVAVAALAASAESWKAHPAFDDSPLRIIDTENYTFFLGFQKFYDTNFATCKEPVTAGFIYRKDDPEKGILPAVDIWKLNGASIRTCEYSPEGRFLAILYMDGGMDVVDDSGEIRYNDFIKQAGSPGWRDVKSLIVAGKEIWVATASGYVAFNGLSGEVKAKAEMPQDIKLRWIARCGDKIVMIANDRLYDSPADKVPGSYADFNSVSMPSGWWGAANLMPRSDTSFFFLSNHNGSGGYKVNLAWHNGGKWSFREITTANPVLSASGGVVSNIFERNFFRNKEGWIYSTAGGLHQLYNGRDPEAQDIIESIPGMSKADPSSVRVLGMAGSWDGSSCFAYLDRGKFAPGERAEGKWLIDDEGALRPQAPAAAWATHLGYVAGYGTLVMNYGTSWAFPVLMKRPAPLLSAYKNGDWSYPNSVYSVPRSAEENAELNALYRANTDRFPVPFPNGMVVDPVNNDYVWFGSAYSGMAAFNLRDPKADPIHLGSPADPLASYPGFYELLENPEKWNGYAPLSTPSFDADGNLWTTHHYYVDRPGKGQGMLFCWPRANREKVMDSGNVKEIEGIKVLELGASDKPNSYMKCLASTHPSTRNTLFVYLTDQPRRICRFNHGGTLDDTSDDTFEYFQSIEDQHGGRWPVNYCFRMVEDPSTGKVWMGDYAFLVAFDPAAEIVNGVIKGEVLEVADKEYQGNPLAFMEVASIAFDDNGRMWVATNGNGVWGFSADRKKVIAHYTAATSHLPDDHVYGLVWNPETRSLMVSTYEGLAEVWPETVGSVDIADASVAVWPREVKPDYTGPVMVSGLIPGTTIYVADRNGIDIASMKADADGGAVWMLTDDYGKPVKSGFYILRGSFGKIEIAVMR